MARCRECSGRRLAFGSARAAVAYDRSVARLVAAWKEQGLRKLAVLAADLVAEVIPPPAQAAALVFVPADDERRLKRGFHPAERLARELGVRWGLPVTPLLVRTGTSRRQRGLTLRERRRNVKQAFRAVETPPPSLVLVDDVYTSGATAAAAASALRKAGARRVDVVTFARAVR